MLPCVSNTFISYLGNSSMPQISKGEVKLPRLQEAMGLRFRSATEQLGKLTGGTPPEFGHYVDIYIMQNIPLQCDGKYKKE
jgi:hypothetical protein